MPINPATGTLVPFTPAEIMGMNIRTAKVRPQEHPIESRDPYAATMERTFRVTWPTRYDFVALVLGDVVAYNQPIQQAANAIALSRLPPDPTYGVHPNRLDIIATKIVDMRGFGRNAGDNDDGQMPIYPDADVTVHYEAVPFNIKTDQQIQIDFSGSELGRYITPPMDFSPESEYTTLPGGCLHYVVQGGIAAGNPVPHLRAIQFNLGKVTPIQKFSTRWIRLPQRYYQYGSPLQTLLFQGAVTDNPAFSVPWIGCVNSKAFLGYPPGTLLLENVIPVVSRDLLGRGWNYDLKFLWAYRPTTWLTLPYFDPTTPANSGYYFVSNGNNYFAPANYFQIPDNTCLYNVRDFNSMYLPLAF